jgi:hypothetical protein
MRYNSHMEPLPDPEIEELKKLVQKDIEIGDETRKMVASMRRSARWGIVFQVMYWLLILGVLGAAYYYVSPYVSEVFGFYKEVQQSSANGGFVQSLFDTVGKYVSTTTRSR